jgi:ribosomal protein S18 acetylase RimI-like enzyme
MTADDHEAVMAFWETIEGIYLHQEETETSEGFTRTLARNEALSTVACDDGRIVGAVLCTHDGRRGTLRHLAVHKDYRKKGIGRALVEHSLAALRREGIRGAIVAVLKDNPQGRAFWERLGYERIDSVDWYVRHEKS